MNRPVFLASSAALVFSIGSTVSEAPAQSVTFANGRVVTVTTPERHPAVFEEMVLENFRMVSIDVWGPKELGTLTAIWEPNPGPAWHSHHFLTSSSYQEKFDLYTSLGFQPSRVCHTGDGIGRYGKSPGRYACLFVDDGVPAFGRHGQTYEEFRDVYEFAQANDFILESLTVYDTPRLFSSVWRLNVEEVEWVLLGGLDSESYQHSFDAVAIQGFGPHTVTAWKNAEKPDEELYYAVMQKPMNVNWIAYHDVQVRDHQDKMDELVDLGFTPRHMSRGGNHYIGVWQQ